MTTTKKLTFIGATVLALALGHGTARAIEPEDNTAPWSPGASNLRTNSVTLYNASGGLTSWGATPSTDRQIQSVGDIDYAVMTCGRGTGSPAGTIKSIDIGFTHAAGDLDMFVYDPMGTVLGSSQGVSNTESVTVSALNLNAVVLKVYGYAGATNSYSVTLRCQ
jgi:hypothetical protein